jgi:hypothetical protein
MAVKCPALEWPGTLEERGPSEDPSILLTGTARLGGTPVAIMAVRINAEFRPLPDYKSGPPDGAAGAHRAPMLCKPAVMHPSDVRAP